jgi:hypothetical protein
MEGMLVFFRICANDCKESSRDGPDESDKAASKMRRGEIRATRSRVWMVRCGPNWGAVGGNNRTYIQPWSNIKLAEACKRERGREGVMRDRDEG